MDPKSKYIDITACKNYVIGRMPGYSELQDMLEIARRPQLLGIEAKPDRTVIAFLEDGLDERKTYEDELADEQYEREESEHLSSLEDG